ncbi:hypothetical protein [Pseudoroseicyclus sp. CXY001]|uniref:hypothetical protein n=1 Tax=Pseudoroseicyclus sp. CXY001 TaxID=3242492 RepID=UPI00357097FF
MRDFFIRSFEMLVNVIVVLMVVFWVIAVIGTLIGPAGAMGVPKGVAFVGALVGGGIYVVLMAGLLYMGLGIYQNTKRTADALEARTGV